MRLLCLLLAGCGGLLPSGMIAVAPDVTHRALDATVRIGPTGELGCAGTLHRQYIITTFHCVRDPEVVYNVVYRGSPEAWDAEIVASDPRSDLALLRTARRGWRGLPLSSAPPRYGEGVVMVGHPFGLAWSLVTGVVSHPRRQGGQTPNPTMSWLQISSPASPGNSGGPILDRRGHIVGILSFGMTGSNHVAGAVHLDRIRALVEEAVVAEQRVSHSEKGR